MRRKRQFSRIILCPTFCPHTLPDTDIKRLTPPIMTNSERLKFFFKFDLMQLKPEWMLKTVGNIVTIIEFDF